MTRGKDSKETISFYTIATDLKKEIVTSVGSMFVELKEKINEMQQNMDSKFAKVDLRFNALESKVGGIELKVEHQEITLNEVKKDVKSALEIQSQMKAHDNLLKNHEKRIKNLEVEGDSKI